MCTSRTDRAGVRSAGERFANLGKQSRSRHSSECRALPCSTRLGSLLRGVFALAEVGKSFENAPFAQPWGEPRTELGMAGLSLSSSKAQDRWPVSRHPAPCERSGRV